MTDPRSSSSSALRAATLIVPPLIIGVLSLVMAVRQPLWRDEMATYSFALLDPVALVRATGHVDAATAPYYLLLSLLQHVAPGPLGLRLPSILAGMGGALVVGSLGRRWFGVLPGAVAGLVFAVDPQTVSMAATARPYALAAFFIALAAWLLDRAVRDGRARWWIGYAASLAAAGLTHLLAVAIVPAFLVLAWRGRRRLLALVVSTVAAGLVVLPIVVAAYGQRAQIAWIGRTGIKGSADALAFLVTYVGGIGPVPRYPLAVLVVVIAALAFAVFVRVGARDRARYAAVAAALYLSPCVVLYLVSRVSSPVLRADYLTPAVIGYALAVGAAVGSVTRVATRSERVASVLAVILSGFLVALSVVSTASVVPAPWRYDDLPALGRALNDRMRPGDRLVVVQLYPEGGLRAGVALYSGDDAWFRELEAQLPDGAPRASARTVRSTDPLVTSASSAPTAGGRTWVVYLDDPRTIVSTPGARAAIGCTGRIRFTDTVHFGESISRAVCSTS